MKLKTAGKIHVTCMYKLMNWYVLKKSARKYETIVSEIMLGFVCKAFLSHSV